MMGTTIVLDDLTVAYERHPALHHVSGRFAPGSLTAVLGPNGAGKSTLLKVIAGLIRPAAGAARREPVTALAYLPQRAEIERDFPIRVGDAVLAGRWQRLGWQRAAVSDDLAAVAAALGAVGLAGFERRPIGTLSVGQFQRMLFARLMLREAGLILLDEPFAGVDGRTTEDLLAVVAGWHREGRTVVAVLHDLAQARAHFPEALVLARELVAWGPTEATLTPAVLARARLMEEAWDEAAAPCAHDGVAA